MTIARHTFDRSCRHSLVPLPTLSVVRHPRLVVSGPLLGALSNDHWSMTRGEQRAMGKGRLGAEYTGRLFREGKAAISREVAEIFERLGTGADLAGTAREAEQRPALGAVFRGQSSALQGGRRAVGPAPGGQFGRVPGGRMAAGSSDCGQSRTPDGRFPAPIRATNLHRGPFARNPGTLWQVAATETDRLNSRAVSDRLKSYRRTSSSTPTEKLPVLLHPATNRGQDHARIAAPLG